MKQVNVNIWLNNWGSFTNVRDGCIYWYRNTRRKTGQLKRNFSNPIAQLLVDNPIKQHHLRQLSIETGYYVICPVIGSL